MKKIIHIGKVRRPHGVKGEIGVAWNNNECPIKEDASIILRLSEKESKFKIEKIRQGTGKTILKLKDIDDRDTASTLTNSLIYALETDLLKLNKNQYYVHQLVGLNVVDEKNQNIGKISAIYPTGSNDVYEIMHEGKTFLIPAISSVIKEINIEKSFIKIEVIEGLFEDE